MALIVCPECGIQVSDAAEACPNCGFPIRKTMEDGAVHIYRKDSAVKKVFIIIDDAEIGMIRRGKYFDIPVSKGCHDLQLICKKKIAVQKEISITNDFPDFRYAFKTKAGSKIKEINPEKVKWPKLNVAKCPTCGSMRVRQLMPIERDLNMMEFGSATNSFNKTFVCKDCGYKW